MIITYLIQNRVFAISKVSTKTQVVSFFRRHSNVTDADSLEYMYKRLRKEKVAFVTDDAGDYQLEDCVFQTFPNV